MKVPLSQLQAQTDNTVTLQLEVNENLSAFNGHFDGAPIIPGAVQIEWALYFFNQYLNAESLAYTVKQLSALKFQQVIQPNDQVLLSLEFITEKNTLSFNIFNDQHKFSSGKILLVQ